MKRMIHFLLALLGACALTACSGGGGGSTTEVGDDTYVPDFQAGSLSFTEVWVPDKMQTGAEEVIHFHVEAEEPKYNVYVKIDLIELDTDETPSDIVIDAQTYKPDFELTGFVIDSSVVEDTGLIDQDNPQPIILEKGRKYFAEKVFPIPDGIPDGTYAAIFVINQEDYFPEDDNLQGEVQGRESENFIVAGATIVGTPPLPNLRILSTELENSSFELEGLEPIADESNFYLSKDPILNLNLEVESMAKDTVEPVDLSFKLKIGGVDYPLWFERENPNDVEHPDFADTWTYNVVCKDVPVETAADGEQGLDSQEKESVAIDLVEEVQTEQRCASLFRQSQVGKTYKLYLTPEAAAVLETQTENTPCDLIITMESAQAEYQDRISDNVETLPVVYLPPEQEAAVQTLAYSSTGYEWETILNKRSNGGFGNSWFGANYTAAPMLKWRKNSAGRPAAALNNIEFTAKGKLFGSASEILNVWQKTDMDLENIEGSYFDYGAEVYGTKIWGSRTYMGSAAYGQIKPRELWSAGARYSKSQNFFSRSYWYFPYGIPVNVTARAYGTVGLRGSVYVGELNTLGLNLGPYVNANGQLEGSVSVGVARAGVGGWVRLIEIYPESRATLQLQPSIPLATAKFQQTLNVSSMRGKLYLFGDRVKWKRWKHFWKRRSYTLLNWKGWHATYYPFNPIVKSFSTSEFNVEYYPNTTLTGTAVKRTETAIDHSWYHSGPEALGGQRTGFSARWTGTFGFKEGTYTFVALTDDGFRLWVGDRLVLDQWHGQAATQYEVPVSMTEGEHNIKVEYYQGSGGAVAKLLWYKSN